jgi:hypothetical protein
MRPFQIQFSGEGTGREPSSGRAGSMGSVRTTVAASEQSRGFQRGGEAWAARADERGEAKGDTVMNS